MAPKTKAHPKDASHAGDCRTLADLVDRYIAKLISEIVPDTTAVTANLVSMVRGALISVAQHARMCRSELVGSINDEKLSSIHDLVHRRVDDSRVIVPDFWIHESKAANGNHVGTKRPRQDGKTDQSVVSGTIFKGEPSALFDFKLMMEDRDAYNAIIADDIAALEDAVVGFSDDSQFIAFTDMYFALQQWTSSIANRSTPNINTLGFKNDLSETDLTRIAMSVFTLIDIFGKARLAKTVNLPRVARTCASFGFSRGFSCATMLVLSISSGTLASHMSGSISSLAFIGHVACLSAYEIQLFAASEQQHVKQGLIHINDPRNAKLVSEFRVGMTQEVLTALSGCDLSEEELIKLEQTCLWNVLQAEKSGNFGIIKDLSVEKKRKKGSAAASAYVTKRTVEDKSKGSKGLTTKLKELLGEQDFPDCSSADHSDDDAEGGSSEEDDEEEDGAGTRTSISNSAVNTPALKAGDRVASDASQDSQFPPYKTDIEYVDDAFSALSQMIKVRNSQCDIKDDDDNYFHNPKNKVEAQLREQLGRQRMALSKISARMDATKAAGPWLPRVEIVSEKLGLTQFEKQILLLLVGAVVSHDILVAINGRYVMRDGQKELTVGYILFVLCESLEERVSCRSCFYRTSPLIANGIIGVSNPSALRNGFNTDLMDYFVDIDRSIVDYLMGTNPDTDELVHGSKLYEPKIPIKNVALPPETKTKVMETIDHYSLFAKCKAKCGFGEGLGISGSGLVFLFFGPSGTGKTMLANAVAHDLGKRILLVNLMQFKNDVKAPDMLRFVFREAKLNDAIIFFDECEGFFENRDSNQLVTSVLAEFEKYDGMIILATNKAQIIDEAMNRRISLMVEFKMPDYEMRKNIWELHVPHELKLDPSVCLDSIAIDYELTGGLIRNAMLSAISHAVGREKCELPTITMADLVHGAKQQLRGFFQAFEKPTKGAERYITPRRSFDAFVADDRTRKSLETIARLAKARNTLFSQWGFSEQEYEDQAPICLFYGMAGSGKSLAVEAIAYECGCTIRMCNVDEMLLTASVDIGSVFEEGQKLGAIIAFDQCQSLFDYSDKSRQITQLIQYHATRYHKPVILMATTGGNISSVDSRAASVNFSLEVNFQLPTKALRQTLWTRAFPEQVPLSGDVSFEALAEAQITAKDIRAIAFGACAKAALRIPAERRVSMEDIKTEMDDYRQRDQRRKTHSSMFT